MSRTYEMDVVIRDVLPSDVRAVKSAAQDVWEFQNWYYHNRELSAFGVSTLTGGESEDEFADRLAETIWDVIDKFCTVEVKAFYLENLPCEDHVRGADEYEEWQVGRSQWKDPV